MDNNANNYMLLQQRNVRIPLLAKNGTWKFTINKEKWEIPDCMELLYAYHLIGNQDYRTTSETLRANYKHITPIQIEAFIQHFEKTHPIEEYQFDINEVPVYATQNSPLEIPHHQSYRILLTPEQEREILDLMKGESDLNRRREVRQWFRRYTERYALKPRNPYQILSHYDALGDMFYELHGIDITTLCDIERTENKKKEKEEWERNRWKGDLYCIGAVFLMILYQIALVVLCLGVMWILADALFWHGGGPKLFD